MEELNDEKDKGEYEVATVSVEETTDHEDAPVIKLSGELDLSTIETLRPTLDAIVTEHPARLTFELSGLTFLDSSGIALLAEAAQAIETVVLANASTLIRRVLESTGLKDIFRLEP